MMTSLLKKAQPDPKDFFYSVTQLMKPISEAKLLKEDLINSGVLEYWLEYANTLTEEEFSYSVDARIEILGFSTEVWINYSEKIEENEKKAVKIIELLKKSTEDVRITVKLVAITHLFRLFELFADKKKVYAPLIYKTLTMVLLENHSDLEIREFLMRNFISIFEEFANIPMNPLFEPLMKQIQISENSSYFLNMSDFSLFIFFAKRENLNVKSAIQLLDFLAKVFLNEMVFAQICSLPMVSIILKHKNNETMQEFVVKFVKICLAMLYASEKKKNSDVSRSINQAVFSLKNPNYAEIEVLNSQKRAMIIEILRQICSISANELLIKIKPLIAHTCLQIKDFTRKNHKGLVLMLNMFGNAEEILEKFEQIYKESLKEREKLEESNINSNVNSSADKFKSPNSFISTKKTKNLPSLKPNNADPKALRAIEETHQNFQMKITGKIRLEEESQKLIEKQKASLRKQLEIRTIQQGVGILNQKDIEIGLIFEENDPKLKELAKNTGENIEIINIEVEEERDRLLIEEFNRKSQKIFKFLFLKFANSGYWTKQETFSSISSTKSQKISISELIKLFREHGYSSLINQEKVSLIIKALSLLFTGNKISFNTLDFSMFVNFFMQMAFFAHSKEFNNISSMMEQMMKNFRDEEKKQGLNVAIYDDPDINFIYESSVVKEINKNLQEDPEYVLPEVIFF